MLVWFFFLFKLFALWEQLLNSIESTNSFDNQLLANIESILIAGFGNKHKKIKAPTVEFWRKTFAEKFSEPLRYPNGLIPTIKQIKKQYGEELKFPNTDEQGQID